MGLLHTTHSLAEIEKVTASGFFSLSLFFFQFENFLFFAFSFSFSFSLSFSFSSTLPLSFFSHTSLTITTPAFARRRLPVVLVRLKFAENLTQAMTFVEHGHIRIGPEVVTDVAYHVTRTYEDFITWVDDSKIVRHIRKYNDGLDDFDLL